MSGFIVTMLKCTLDALLNSIVWVFHQAPYQIQVQCFQDITSPKLDAISAPWVHCLTLLKALWAYFWYPIFVIFWHQLLLKTRPMLKITNSHWLTTPSHFSLYKLWNFFSFTLMFRLFSVVTIIALVTTIATI